MLLANLTIRELFSCLLRQKPVLAMALSVGLIGSATAQDNSPYSRYGLGDEGASSNIANRGMGGLSAAYNNFYNINYSNPSSYAYFFSQPEPNSRKQLYGRVILDVGVESTIRTLVDKEAQSKFTSSNILFHHMMMGLPLRKNWGIAFGIRPLYRINYKIAQNGPLKDAGTGNIIDSASTEYEGSGGLYLATFGTGFKFKTGKNGFLSLGANAGYAFGKRDYSTRRSLFNDSTIYTSGNWQRKTNIGGLYVDAGVQFHSKLTDKLYLGIGINGNWEQKLNTSNDETQETYYYNEDVGNQPIDTILTRSSTSSNLIMPMSVTGGFVLQKTQQNGNEAGWLVGVDFTSTNWNSFRYEGLPDTAVASNWKLKIGAEFSPARKKSYASAMYYRVGFTTGPDYITLRGQQLPTYGISAGLGLPLANYNQQASNQQTMINLAFEYLKRGNNRSILQENLFRISVGFSLTDLWLAKRRNQ